MTRVHKKGAAQLRACVKGNSHVGYSAFMMAHDVRPWIRNKRTGVFGLRIVCNVKSEQ